MQRFFIIITGPTAVGKTALVDQVIARLPFRCAILNGDMGQLYTSLTIGTAKPDYKKSETPHYLFDVLDEPANYTITEYRKQVYACMEMLWEQGIVPVVVGGSGFYVKSLYFVPKEYPIIADVPADLSDQETATLYEQLVQIDNQRAVHIHPHDRYRILRALEIWYTTGVLPSQAQPLYKPEASSMVIFLQRNTAEMHQRIETRTQQMILQDGWIREVENLPAAWKDFLQEKKIIGYPEIIAYLKQAPHERHMQDLIDDIVIKTRQYAKRQRIFFAMLQRELQQAYDKDDKKEHRVMVQVKDLTLSNDDLYLRETINEINAFKQKVLNYERN